jgi:hypothetical protein
VYDTQDVAKKKGFFTHCGLTKKMQNKKTRRWQELNPRPLIYSK